jgi:hypothetical protein
MLGEPIALIGSSNRAVLRSSCFTAIQTHSGFGEAGITSAHPLRQGGPHPFSADERQRFKIAAAALNQRHAGDQVFVLRRSAALDGE